MKSIDGGPIYAETDFSRIPVEPLNTYSELAVLLVAIYWLTRKDRSTFAALCSVVLSVQWAGATLYHALRNHYLWLLLDVVPILLFVVMVVANALRLGWKNKTIYQLVLLVLVSPVVFMGSASVTYFGLALFCLAALLPVCIDNKRQLGFCIAAQLTFILALTFRELDNPLNTHFLWHLFAALASHLLIYTTESVKMKDKNCQPEVKVP